MISRFQFVALPAIVASATAFTVLLATSFNVVMAPAAIGEPRTLPHEHASSWHVRVTPELSPAGVGAALVSRPLRTAAALLSRLEGLASFYWQDQKTASGERFDKTALTAAHKTLPFHTRVRVTNINNGRSVVVRINDRGPFRPDRIIDLSDAAAGVIGMKSQGLARVRLEVIE